MTETGGGLRKEAAKWIAGGFAIVAVIEVLAIVMAHHRHVMWASGVAVALVLFVALRLLSLSTEPAPMAPASDRQAESMRRWIARTETMIRWADSTRADWDRRLRPKLAREFVMATGHRQKDPANLQATGRIVFGDELWQWVDPGNVSRTGTREPGPGRGALEEILQRLERV